MGGHPARITLFRDGAPDDGTTGPVVAVLGAGFDRSTLPASAAQPVTDAAPFYRSAVTYHCAAAMRAATADGRAYGFAFDDVTDRAPLYPGHGPHGRPPLPYLFLDFTGQSRHAGGVGA